MPFLELSTQASPHHPDDVENCFFGAGALSVTLEDAQDHPILEPKPGTTPLWPTVRVKGLFDHTQHVPDLIEAIRNGLEDPLLKIEWRHVADRAWEREWLKDFKPMRFGQHLWICPGGQEPTEASALNKIIWLDPGLAFGTGTHATTALCLEYLDQHHPLNAKVLDVGCGSGILSLAAMLLGARSVHALDIDPQALIATSENAQRNGFASAIRLTDEKASWDVDHELVLANILAEPLIELAPAIAHATQAAGRVVLSGLLDVQSEAVSMAYQPYFEMDAPVYKEGWAMLVGTRRSHTP